MILKGQTNQGVYTCSLFSTVVYSTITSKCPSSTWHHRLGHSSTKVFNTLSSFLNVSPSTSSFTPACNDCHVNKSHKLPFYKSTLLMLLLILFFLMFSLLLFYLMIILNTTLSLLIILLNMYGFTP